MPAPGHTMAVGVMNGKLYLAGGDHPENVHVATLQVYDPAQDTWTSKASMPAPRAGAGGAVVDGLFYVLGGTTDRFVSVVQAYDPARNAWASRSPCRRRGPCPLRWRSAARSTRWRPDQWRLHGCNEEYDPASNAWTARAAMPTARVGAAAVAVGNGAYVVGGGVTGPPQESAALEVYFPPRDELRPGGPACRTLRLMDGLQTELAGAR